MMKMRFGFFLSVMAVCATTCISCGEKGSGPVIADRSNDLSLEKRDAEKELKSILPGGWKDENSRMSFMADGRLYVEFDDWSAIHGEGRWEVKQNVLRMIWKGETDTTTDDYEVIAFQDNYFSYKSVNPADTAVFHATRIR